MRSRKLLYLLSAAVLATTSAHANVILLAQATLGGSAAGPNADLSGLSGTLENGLPANFLGGTGSGIAYAGGNTFLSVPDRGPNATPYNSDLDDTVSYIARFHTMNMQLTANAPGSSLPFTLTPTLNKTTLLSSKTPLVYGDGSAYGVPAGDAVNTPGNYYFTGRSDNFDPAQNSGNPADARLDPESIRVSNDGKSVFISDEYGPYIYQFDRATGQRIKSFELPGNLYVDNVRTTEDAELADNTSGRTTNKGMEGLALTPDGKTLVGAMQAALIQDAATKATKKIIRLVTVDVESGETHEYAYQLTAGSGVSDIVAINDHQFLIDERDGAGLGDGSAAVAKQVFQIDLTGATDVTNLSGDDLVAAVVGKSPFVDLVSLLEANGYADTEIPAKIEGLSFGQDVLNDGVLYHTLYVANDNDFLPDEAGENKFFVLGFTDDDLPGFQAQVFAPEPATLTMLGAALFGVFGFRRRVKPALSI